MTVVAGDIRAEMTLDVSKFSEGVARAQSALSTLTEAGQRVSNDFANVEGRFAQSATAIAESMRQAGQGGDELLQLAARADAAQLKLEATAGRATAAAEALSAAQAAARQSGDALTLLKDSAAASAEDLMYSSVPSNRYAPRSWPAFTCAKNSVWFISFPPAPRRA